MSKRLYRYIGFEDFVNLFINNKERFVSPVRWDDKNEGFLFSHFENQDDMHNIVSEMYYHLSDKNYKAIIDNYFRMWNSKWSVRAQCWSKHSETDAMWRCYSYENRALRIRTTDEKLLKHVETIYLDKKTTHVYLREVIYDLNLITSKEKDAEKKAIEKYLGINRAAPKAQTETPAQPVAAPVQPTTASAPTATAVVNADNSAPEVQITVKEPEPETINATAEVATPAAVTAPQNIVPNVSSPF